MLLKVSSRNSSTRRDESTPVKGIHSYIVTVFRWTSRAFIASSSLMQARASFSLSKASQTSRAGCCFVMSGSATSGNTEITAYRWRRSSAARGTTGASTLCAVSSLGSGGDERLPARSTAPVRCSTTFDRNSSSCRCSLSL